MRYQELIGSRRQTHHSSWPERNFLSSEKNRYIHTLFFRFPGRTRIVHLYGVLKPVCQGGTPCIQQRVLIPAWKGGSPHASTRAGSLGLCAVRRAISSCFLKATASLYKTQMLIPEALVDIFSTLAHHRSLCCIVTATKTGEADLSHRL